MAQEEIDWKIFNMILVIKSSYRSLKTDLDLRPKYQKNDETTMAHLHLGLLAYRLTNTVRHQLKAKKINYAWLEIVRITNTQNLSPHLVKTRLMKSSLSADAEPQLKVKEIYQAINYNNYLFVKRKSVVHKPEPTKEKSLCLQDIEYQ